MQFATEQEIKNYIESKITQSLPNGWVANFRIQPCNIYPTVLQRLFI
ncbi:MAG: hypothetical protein KME21_23140 [Desmonostoc vinosum HA7617-LM4]|jgi:hypothetical protein|nr:hypothetical protein [Desmonostoc vinosum HA7617-LM4]